jgi:hypothetical protein
MVLHQDVAMEMSTRLQAAQQEIRKLRNQLRDSDATIIGYQRMVAGEANDLSHLTPTPGQPPPQVQE